MPILTQEQIEELYQFDTPTICNAIERFQVRKKTSGFMNYEIKQQIPYDKPLVGYAATGKISAMHPVPDEKRVFMWNYYDIVKAMQKPTVSVIQDTDPYPIGAFWGDVQASVHLALGCEGVITSGGVRDLDEVKKLGFQFFAKEILVSHAYVHVEDYNCPVVVGGITVNPGDLIHADKHGVCIIPNEIADKVAMACRKSFYAEEPVITFCREAIKSGTLMDLVKYREKREEMAQRLNEVIDKNEKR